MSTSPPPSTPPFGPGFPQGRLDRATARAQRRTVADQARFQRDQARFQREQVRLQLRAARRNSAVGPLLLLTLGIVLLLLETGHWQWRSAFVWLGRWWPLVLILAGAILLGEYAWDRARPISLKGIPVRRSLGGGTAALLILLALVGVTASVADSGADWARHALGENWEAGDLSRLPGLFGSEYTESLDTALAPGGTLTISNPLGDISVTGSSQDGRVHVSVHQHVSGWNNDEVGTKHGREMPRFSGDAHHVVLSAASQDADRADLSVQLPHEAGLAIHSDHGDISVEELRGTVDVTAQNGNVKLTALRGPVRIVTADDDTEIDAHSLTGGLTLQGRTGDINLSDLEGPLSLTGDFFGTTHLEHIHGAVHFKSSFTDFSCADLPGDLNVEGRSDLDARQIGGPVILTTTNRNITLDAVRGAATVTDRNGSVHLGLASPLQPVSVNDADGSVELVVPAGSGFALQSSTRNGEIHNSFGLSATKSGEVAQLTQRIGTGGPPIHLQTSEADITVQIGGAAISDTWDDNTTRITATPSGKIATKAGKPR